MAFLLIIQVEAKGNEREVRKGQQDWREGKAGGQRRNASHAVDEVAKRGGEPSHTRTDPTPGASELIKHNPTQGTGNEEHGIDRNGQGDQHRDRRYLPEIVEAERERPDLCRRADRHPIPKQLQPRIAQGEPSAYPSVKEKDGKDGEVAQFETQVEQVERIVDQHAEGRRRPRIVGIRTPDEEFPDQIE